jgi:hypothetical protein
MEVGQVRRSSSSVPTLADVSDNLENETAVLRWDYGDAQLGTCKESIQGGNHFRYWIQNGDKGNRSVSLRMA